MIRPEDLTRDLVVDSLYSETCPACGGPKKDERSVCYSCWNRLPFRIQKALYQRVGHGYEPALADALNHLQATRFHEPRF